MLSLKTLCCLKTVLRQFSRCLGLGVASFVLEFTHTAAKEGLHPCQIFSYCQVVNCEDFYADEQTNVFASHEYSAIRPLFYRLLSVSSPHFLS